jgi:hypothetical protein
MRPPGYETLDRGGAGRPLEFAGRETMMRRSQLADIGQRDPDAATRVRDEDLADVELRQMRLRILELSA